MSCCMRVGHWNSYFNEMMYLSTNTKFPLQLVLREILVNMGTAGMTLDVTKQLEMQGNEISAAVFKYYCWFCAGYAALSFRSRNIL